MTLYKVLKALESSDFEGDYTINFPEGFPIESGDLGFSGATFATIAMEAPEAFTLKVTGIRTYIDSHGWDTAEIDTEYGRDYVGNVRDIFKADDEPLSISEILDLRGFNPMVEDARDFTLRECNEIAVLAGTTIYEVIETLGTMVL